MPPYSCKQATSLPICTWQQILSYFSEKGKVPSPTSACQEPGSTKVTFMPECPRAAHSPSHKNRVEGSLPTSQHRCSLLVSSTGVEEGRGCSEGPGDSHSPALCYHLALTSLSREIFCEQIKRFQQECSISGAVRPEQPPPRVMAGCCANA